MDEDTALKVLRQIEIDQVKYPNRIHEEFDQLAIDYIRHTGAKKLAKFLEQRAQVNNFKYGL